MSIISHKAKYAGIDVSGPVQYLSSAGQSYFETQSVAQAVQLSTISTGNDLPQNLNIGDVEFKAEFTALISKVKLKAGQAGITAGTEIVCTIGHGTFENAQFVFGAHSFAEATVAEGEEATFAFDTTGLLEAGQPYTMRLEGTAVPIQGTATLPTGLRSLNFSSSPAFYPYFVISYIVQATSTTSFLGSVGLKNPDQHKINLKISDVQAVDYDILLPATQGASGTLLMNDGAGAMRWTDSLSKISDSTSVTSVDASKISMVVANVNSHASARILESVTGNGLNPVLNPYVGTAITDISGSGTFTSTKRVSGELWGVYVNAKFPGSIVSDTWTINVYAGTTTSGPLIAGPLTGTYTSGFFFSTNGRGELAFDNYVWIGSHQPYTISLDLGSNGNVFVGFNVAALDPTYASYKSEFSGNYITSTGFAAPPCIEFDFNVRSTTIDSEGAIAIGTTTTGKYATTLYSASTKPQRIILPTANATANSVLMADGTDATHWTPQAGFTSVGVQALAVGEDAGARIDIQTTFTEQNVDISGTSDTNYYGHNFSVTGGTVFAPKRERYSGIVLMPGKDGDSYNIDPFARIHYIFSDGPNGSGGQYTTEGFATNISGSAAHPTANPSWDDPDTLGAAVFMFDNPIFAIHTASTTYSIKWWLAPGVSPYPVSSIFGLDGIADGSPMFGPKTGDGFTPYIQLLHAYKETYDVRAINAFGLQHESRHPLVTFLKNGNAQIENTTIYLPSTLGDPNSYLKNTGGGVTEWKDDPIDTQTATIVEDISDDPFSALINQPVFIQYPSATDTLFGYWFVPDHYISGQSLTLSVEFVWNPAPSSSVGTLFTIQSLLPDINFDQSTRTYYSQSLNINSGNSLSIVSVTINQATLASYGWKAGQKLQLFGPPAFRLSQTGVTSYTVNFSGTLQHNRVGAVVRAAAVELAAYNTNYDFTDASKYAYSRFQADDIKLGHGHVGNFITATGTATSNVNTVVNATNTATAIATGSGGSIVISGALAAALAGRYLESITMEASSATGLATMEIDINAVPLLIRNYFDFEDLATELFANAPYKFPDNLTSFTFTIQNTTTTLKGTSSAVTDVTSSGTFAGFVPVLTFKTSGYDVYSTVTSKLKIANAEGTGVGLKIPSTIAANYDVTLPTAQAASTAVLKNDGTGALAWDTDTLLVISGTLSSAQLLTLHNTRIQLIPAAGANRMNVVESTVFNFQRQTTFYTGGGTGGLILQYYKLMSTTDVLSLAMPNTAIDISDFVSKNGALRIVQSTGVPQNDHVVLYKDCPIYVIKNDATALTGGDGIMHYTIRYRIIDIIDTTMFVFA